MNIEGKTVLITGANRGLGLHLVQAFTAARAGKIYACMRTLSKAPDYVGPATNIKPTYLDLLDNGCMNADSLRSKFGDVAIIVNNAAIVLMGSATDPASATKVDLTMKTNFAGPVKLVSALASNLEQNKSCAVVNISSMVAKMGWPDAFPYHASKVALNAYTENLRHQFRDKGILVSSVQPGPIATDMSRNAGGKLRVEPAENVARRIVEGIRSDAEEIYPDPFAAHFNWKLNEDPASVAELMRKIYAAPDQLVELFGDFQQGSPFARMP